MIRNIASNFKKTRQEIKSLKLTVAKTQTRTPLAMRDQVLNTSAASDKTDESPSTKKWSNTSMTHRKPRHQTIRETISSCSPSRYDYSPRSDSVNLKVVPNCEVSPREHFRTVSASSTEKRATHLHVPTRREHFNSKTSLHLGGTSHKSVDSTAEEKP